MRAALVERLRELFPDADTVRISAPRGRMFLIIGHKRHTKDDPGQWVDQDGNACDWEYTAEKTVAAGNTDAELFEDARNYTAIERMTWDDYFASLRREAESVSADGKD